MRKQASKHNFCILSAPPPSLRATRSTAPAALDRVTFSVPPPPVCTETYLQTSCLDKWSLPKLPRKRTRKAKQKSRASPHPLERYAGASSSPAPSSLVTGDATQPHQREHPPAAGPRSLRVARRRYLDPRPCTLDREGLHVAADLFGGTAVQLFATALPAHLHEQMLASITPLAATQRPNVRKRSRSRQQGGATYRFGWALQYSGTPRPIRGTEAAAAQNWLQENRPVFRVVHELLKEHFPELCSILEGNSAFIADNPISPFATVVVNVDFAVEPHRNKNDYKEGLAVVIPLGDFTGGQLFFPEINVTVNTQPGDVVAFRSARLTHSVLPYVGTRHSVILFTQDNMIKV
ncbi:hypothetical protein QOT17_004295 [Balamuthia mandrillaris]